MEISLKNFKIWRDKVLKISNNGIILLSGKSGKGKSSILDSIAFCLYDIGRNLKTYGQKDLCVSLDFGDFSVKRKKSPNLLQVICKDGNIYENDLAQQFINSTFGDFFKEIGYISQNSFSSFIFLNPAEKFAFIEKVLFKNEDIQGMKDRCKNEIKELNNKLVGTVSNITYISETLSKENLPEEVKFPIKIKPGITIEQIIENQLVKRKNREIKERKLIKDLDNLSSLITKSIKYTHSIKILGIKYEQKNTEIKNLTKELEDLNSVISEINENDITRKIKLFTENREKVALKTKFEELSLKYNEVKEIEEKEKADKLKELNESLFKSEGDESYTMEEAEENLKNLNEFKQNMIKINSLKQELDNIYKKFKIDYKIETEPVNILTKKGEEIKENLDKNKKIIKEKEYSLHKARQYLNILRCPHCKGGVRISNESIVKEESDGEEKFTKEDIERLGLEIKEIKTNVDVNEKRYIEISKIIENTKSIINTISKLEGEYEEIRTSEEIQDGIDFFSDYITTNKQIQKEIKALESKGKSKVLLTLENDLNTVNSKLQKYKIDYNNYEEDDITEDEYIDYMSKLKKLEDIKPKKISIEKRLASPDKDKEDIDEMIRKEDKNKVEEDLCVLENKKVIIEEELNKVKKEIEKIIENSREIDKYLNYKKELAKYNKLNSDLEKLKKDETRLKDDIQVVNNLKDKIIEAETMSISSFIDTLSVHVNTYLERFFKEDPVFVNIQSSKVTNTVKHGIHITIENKGNESSLEHLSGGERDRVSLAFTLALSEMFNNKILLLDECISSLDHETSSHVINGLKDNYKNNLVIVVAHQVNEGLFDNIIRV